MSAERNIISKLFESKRVNESDILSSLQKDVMRAVDAEAPSALHWREGAKILSRKTHKVATFLGYRKDPITGKYYAILSHDGEEVKYSLPDLQKDIKANILSKYA